MYDTQWKRLILCKNGVPEEKVRKCDRRWVEGGELRKTPTHNQEALPCGWEKFITNGDYIKTVEKPNKKNLNRNLKEKVHIILKETTIVIKIDFSTEIMEYKKVG